MSTESGNESDQSYVDDAIDGSHLLCVDERCNEKVKLYNIHRAAWKEEATRLRDEIANLKEIDAMRMKELADLMNVVTTKSATTHSHDKFESMDPIMAHNEPNPSDDAIPTGANDSVTKLMEAVKIFIDSNLSRIEEPSNPCGELKRKHSDEIDVVDNTSVESKTKECISCGNTKPLSVFQTKSRETTRRGKSAVYLITRKKCSSCRSKKRNDTKKAKTS